ncbi:hypothetical protein TrRE_jg1417 [Triparma retinervis]|uniref:Uncharacterized protein n=1 Tax=Triparma retinervis TaxID=2557542 RepID=A0A9W6ZAK8_9STRA|nr:hypothetical protein TrRE_jg1417 [Triparma retinervis]
MSSYYKINVPLPDDLSAESPILISQNCSLRSAMTALEVGCRRMDSEVEGTWSVVSTATKIPFYDGSKTVTDCFESILSAPVLDSPSLCDTVVGRPPASDLLPWALKVNVRVVSYLNGIHTFNESVGTIVMPSAPPEADSGITDKVITLFLRAAISVVTKCRDVVWYGDVYEEEDMGMHYQREKVDSWKTEDEELQAFRGQLGEVKEPELTHTVALLDIYLFYHNYLHNLTARIQNPSPCPSPLVSSVISGLIKSIDSTCCVLPPPPPRVDPTTTYVDHTTTTYSDPPYFQESLLRFVAKGQPTHACRFKPVAESLGWWSAHSKEIEGMEELWKVDVGIPGLLRRLRRHLMKDWSVTMRALFR